MYPATINEKREAMILKERKGGICKDLERIKEKGNYVIIISKNKIKNL